MADFSKMRRKQTAWPGFFSPAPVHGLPGVDLDEDAEVYQRVKHLQHLRAIHEAMEETGPLDTERPGYNPHLTDLFGDLAINPGRFTDAFGNELGIGQTLDALLGKYGPGHTPGAHNEDPGDPRGSSRTGMASQDSGPSSNSQGPGTNPSSKERARKEQEEQMWETVNRTNDYKRELNQLIDTFQGAAKNNPPFRGGADLIIERVHSTQDAFWPFHEWLIEQRRRPNKGDDKPLPDDDRPGLSDRDFRELKRLFTDLQRWGNPATDFKLGRAARARMTQAVWEALVELQQGGHPAVYDRLGHLQRHKQIHLSSQDLKRIGRFENPSINWGPNAQPTETRGPSTIRRLESVPRHRLSFSDDD